MSGVGLAIVIGVLFALVVVNSVLIYALVKSADHVDASLTDLEDDVEDLSTDFDAHARQTDKDLSQVRTDVAEIRERVARARDGGDEERPSHRRAIRPPGIDPKEPQE